MQDKHQSILALWHAVLNGAAILAMVIEVIPNLPTAPQISFVTAVCVTIVLAGNALHWFLRAIRSR